MHRFYFHIRHGQVTVLDHEGVEFADAYEAVREATRRKRQIARASALKGVFPLVHVFVVDEEWQPVSGVPFERLSVRNIMPVVAARPWPRCASPSTELGGRHGVNDPEV